MRDDPFLALCGFLCIWPLLVGFLPGFLIGRFRVRLRSPLSLAERERRMTHEEIRAIVKRPAPADKIGFGGPT